MTIPTERILISVLFLVCTLVTVFAMFEMFGRKDVLFISALALGEDRRGLHERAAKGPETLSSVTGIWLGSFELVIVFSDG